jgi:glycosyltransferase involved in cell wall biosynthesis
MKIAYLMNQHPYASCTFIRREIAAMENCGVEVQRYSIRRPSTALVDPADLEEQKRTRTILDAGPLHLIAGLLGMALTRPGRWWRALGLTLCIGWGSQRGLLRHLVYLAEACLLLRWLHQSAVQHVHAHFATNSTTVAMLCHVLGGPPYSFTVHGPDEFDCPEALKLSEKIARAAFVVAISDYGRSQLFRWCSHEHWPKIHVVHCGLDDLFLGQAPTPIPADRRLVCVGRLSEQKGQLLLMEAAAKLAAEGLDFQILLAGDGPMRSEIEALVQRLGLENHVRLLGWQTGQQVREAILSSRALVLPSFAEGLPVVIMEALALGRPVISTYVAGIPELLTPGVNGWLVPAGAVQPLVDAMREALEASPRKLQEMGQAGAVRVAQQHNAVAEALKLIGWFQAVGSEECSEPAAAAEQPALVQ